MTTSTIESLWYEKVWNFVHLCKVAGVLMQVFHAWGQDSSTMEKSYTCSLGAFFNYTHVSLSSSEFLSLCTCRWAGNNYSNLCAYRNCEQSMRGCKYKPRTIQRRTFFFNYNWEPIKITLKHKITMEYSFDYMGEFQNSPRFNTRCKWDLNSQLSTEVVGGSNGWFTCVLKC